MERSLFASESAGPARYVRVALERGVDAPEGLVYAAPSSMRDIAVGERVVAPLGKGDARAEGFVVSIETTTHLDPAKIKPIRSRTGARLPASLIELARWMAVYYCCPIGMVFASMMPAAVKHAVGRVTRIEVEPSGAEPLGKLPPATRAAWEAVQGLPESVFPVAPRALADRIEATSLGPINRLVRIGLLREVERRVVRAVWPETPPEPPRDLVLSEAQREAIESISSSLGGFAAHLVRGVTGSGKTEVYLRVLRRALDRGLCGIVLVPEISLTPQTVARFRGWFENEGVAVLHSGLTDAQRHHQWALVASGEARVAIGARSAVFAPFDASRGARLGVIIVDEEHDQAYKQGELPRHNARDVAIKRGQIEGCVVVLGSATPSLESWRNAKLGRSRLHELPHRVGGATLPRVEVVDLQDELRAEGDARARLTMLGPRLKRAIGDTLAEPGAQVILLLNRRGYANYICCPDQRCGWMLVCDHCDATMVYHRDRRLPLGGVVRCHHCLAEQKLPELCPECEKRVTTFGVGSQRVEEELPRLFPQLTPGETMLRLDSDSMRTARDYFDALSRFASGCVRLLVGTQMIAKGLDFPGVRLVGVVNADTAINLPDFRAAERTFQLVSQVAGRAGRSVDSGRVLVQTFHPEQPAIRLAARHDYEAFADEELALREAAGLPPASRMARIVVRDEQHAKALEHARRIVEALEEARAGETAVRLRGPMACPISRIAGKHRIAIEVLAPQPGTLQRLLAHARNAGLVKSDARTAVDVDPVMLL